MNKSRRITAVIAILSSAAGFACSDALSPSPSPAKERAAPEPVAVYGSPSDGLAFFPDGAFDFRPVRGEAAGEYYKSDSTLYLSFGPSQTATGTLRGDTLVIDYDGWMELSDFVDEVLLLDRSLTPTPAWQSSRRSRIAFVRP